LERGRERVHVEPVGHDPVCGGEFLRGDGPKLGEPWEHGDLYPALHGPGDGEHLHGDVADVFGLLDGSGTAFGPTVPVSIVVPPESPPERPAESLPERPAESPLVQLRDAVFLVEVEKAGRFWPFATCVAVGKDTLLTSAREAVQLASGTRKRDSKSGS